MPLQHTRDRDAEARARRLDREIADPAIRYLRSGMIVRDHARAAAETHPEAWEWSRTFAYTFITALGACLLSLILQ